MPYEWQAMPAPAPAAPRSPVAQLHLWPYRSLPRRGFVAFVGATAGLIALPMLTILGSPVVWGLMPFAALTLAGVWWGLTRSYRDAEIVEDLTLWPDRITLTRHGPRGRRQEWEANPHWVRVTLHERGGPVPNYLTLQGGPREVELGAFLSEDERLALRQELTAALTRLR
jgi:uncharacterized membrane protein